ncbi:MAG: hypothetical protein ACYC35_15300 [Pirellulales bacterium]
MMTEHQHKLNDMLLSFPRTEAAKKAQKRSPMEFVLQHGWWYEPCEVPAESDRGTIQGCHKNAQLLANDHDSLTYCEGYALANSGSLIVVHAWVTDGTGRAIDITWDEPGVAYAGVPFKTPFIRLTCLKNKAHISLLDDWMNAFPLLNGLGEKPNEWLDERGKGMAMVTGGE